MSGPRRGDYGIDAPGVVRGLAIATVVGIALGAAGIVTGVVPIAAWVLLVLGCGRGLLLTEAAARLARGHARRLPFASAVFDAVVSQFAIHNIRSADGRHDALREIDRVLRPDGRLVVLDLARTDEYCSVLARAGWNAIDRTKPQWGLFPPARYVVATKPR